MYSSIECSRGFAVCCRMPIIANFDVCSDEDAVACLEKAANLAIKSSFHSSEVLLYSYSIEETFHHNLLTINHVNCSTDIQQFWYCSSQMRQIFGRFVLVRSSFGRESTRCKCVGVDWIHFASHAQVIGIHLTVLTTFQFICLYSRFDDAISSYHRALAVNPASTFCAELLTRAMDDSCNFEHFHSDASADGVHRPNQEMSSAFSPCN